MKVRVRGVVFCCLLLASVQVWPWQGVVTHVRDGDTVWIQSIHGGQTHKVRLQGLDAPEICQAWGPHRVRPCMPCCRVKWWRCVGMRMTAMAVCWRS
jgi:hypothetical protein